MDIAVVGSDDFVTGFGLAGVRRMIVAEEDVESQAAKVLEMKEIGILVMEEERFNSLSSKMRKQLERSVKPVLVTISEVGREANLRELIRRSIGVDLWK